MSTGVDRDQLPDFLQRFLPSGAAAVYGIITMFAGCFITMWQLGQGWGFWGLLTGVFTILLVVFRLGFAIPLAVLSVLSQLHITERNWSSYGFQDGSRSFWLVGMALMMFMISGYRYLGLTTRLFPGTGFPWPSLWFANWIRSFKTRIGGVRSSKSYRMEEVWGVGIWPSFMLLLAGLVLKLMPIDQATVSYYGLRASGLRIVAVILLLAVCFFTIQGVLGYLAWRRSTTREASTMLRSEVNRWCGREFESVSRRFARGSWFSKSR